jgi:mannose-1-phosphate guanylyltransferase
MAVRSSNLERSDLVRTSSSQPASDTSDQVGWTLALAGGEGTRLADYVEHRFGRRLPKQYCCLLGRRSMLQHTLERLNKLNPPARTLTVIGTNHGDVATPQLVGLSDHVFRQPSSRDTGVALYVALAMIKRWAPNAVVTVTPTDHYISPAALYVRQVADAQNAAGRRRDEVVLLGIKPVAPDPEFGYVLVSGTESSGFRRAQGFVEKPSEALAKRLIADGALWNTMVACGTVDALLQLGRETQPALISAVDLLVRAIGTIDEERAIDDLYRTQPPIGFSREILAREHRRLLVYELEGIEWSDWGQPDRIERVLRKRRQREVAPRTSSASSG